MSQSRSRQVLLYLIVEFKTSMLFCLKPGKNRDLFSVQVFEKTSYNVAI